MKHHPTIFPGKGLTFLFLIFSCSWCVAATKYVSNSGNNGNSGNSWAQAWLTLQYGADHMGAGDTLWVADGTYVGFDMRTTGTAANPIVFIAVGNNAVINLPTGTTDGINVEEADYIEINGFRVINLPRNGIRLVNAHNCIVRNNYCESSFERGIFTGFTDDILIEYNECLTSDDEHGIYVSNSSDSSIIRYNICHHNNRGGIQINADSTQGGDGISTGPEIYGNILYENGVFGGAAINLDGVQGAFIYNNLLYENHASGIALFQQDGAEPSINATIVHNTIINASDGRWCLLIVNGSSGAQVFNNIIINQHPFRGSIALDMDAVPEFDSDYNIVINRLSRQGDGSSVPLSTWQSYGYDGNSMLADALADLFIVPGSDYHLLDDAQAVDAGSSAFAFGIDEDLQGVSRPQGSQHDIGAYEALGPLAIDTEQEKPKPNQKPDPGIFINHEAISWPDGLNGTLNILSLEGKVISQIDISSAGTYNFQQLTPGIYSATIFNQHGIQWSRWFVRA
jgi:parallel beta-helix repeat protein